MSPNLVPGLVIAPIAKLSEEVSLPAPRSSSEFPEGAKVHDVIIVGSGPAGYTAVIYTARVGLNPFVLADTISAGGALMNTAEVKDFPGFPEGVQGPELMDKMREQVEKFGVETRYEDVIAVNLSGDVKVFAFDDELLYVRSVILATGSEYRHINVEGEDRLSGRGVPYCAACDGFFSKDKVLAVIGRGDSAMEEASFLTNFVSEVIVVHHRGVLRASKSMADRVMMNLKIEFEWNAIVDEVLGNEAVRSLHLRLTADESMREIGVDGVFIAIGHPSRMGFFAEDVALDEAGYITVEEPSIRTSAEGVLACGDAVDHSYRQAITAAGSGRRATLGAGRWLAALND